MGKSGSRTLKIIGRLEHVSFPELKLYDLDAKIDTGAYTSSLHCHHIEKIERDGHMLVQFNLLDPTHRTYNDKLFALPIHREKTVKSSNGVAEERFIIKTDILLHGERFGVELSLTDRSEMKHPVLLGRKLLKGRFLVDTAQTYLSKTNANNEIDH